MSVRSPLLPCVLLCVILGVSCQKPTEPLPLAKIEKNYDRPLPPGQFALRRLSDTSMYPNFGDAWYRAKGLGLRRAVDYSIDYMGKPSSQLYYPAHF